MAEIGKRIKEFAQKNEVSVKDFEQNCGLSIGTVAKESNIRVDNLAKIIQKYPSIDVYYVLTGNHTTSSKNVKIDDSHSQIASEGQEYLRSIIKSQQAMIKAQQDTINTMMTVKGL